MVDCLCGAVMNLVPGVQGEGVGGTPADPECSSKWVRKMDGWMDRWKMQCSTWNVQGVIMKFNTWFSSLKLIQCLRVEIGFTAFPLVLINFSFMFHPWSCFFLRLCFVPCWVSFKKLKIDSLAKCPTMWQVEPWAKKIAWRSLLRAYKGKWEDEDCCSPVNFSIGIFSEQRLQGRCVKLIFI